jgi:pyridoxine 4-dehydrogenase
VNVSNGNPPGGLGILAGRPVARLGYGAMQLSGPGGLTAPPSQTAISVLRRAAELGVNHIDTAHFYGAGLANELIRAALSPYADGLVLVSKVGAEEDAQGRLHLRPAQRPEQLRAGVEANLRSLGVDHVDVVNLRRLDGPPGIQAEGDQLVDLDSQLAEMAALRDEGKIGGIGLSNVSLEQLRHALPMGVACVQNAYSLLDRSGEDLLALCAEHDIAWVPFFPLGSGFPGRAKVGEHPAVVAAAASLGCTPAQAGLAWLLHHDPHILLIPGTASVAHLEENMAVARVRLDAATAATLDTLTAVG